MPHICYRVHLVSGQEINCVALGSGEDADECFDEFLEESRENGFLEIGSRETHMFIIPLENVAFIERIPDFDLDEED